MMHMDNDDTIILTTYKSNDRDDRRRVFQVLVLNLGVVLIVPEAIKIS